MLTRLYVDNFRCMVNFECMLGPRQLVLGSNGSGKSSLFDVLRLLRDFCVRGDPPDPPAPLTRFGGNSRTRWQTVIEQTFEMDVLGNGGEYTFRLVVDSWGNPERPRVLKEEVKLDGKPIFRFEKGEVHLFNDRAEAKVQYPFDWHRSALATIAERKDNTKLTWFKRWLGGLLCVQPNPWAMRGIAAAEAERPDLHLSNFADWYRHLRQESDDIEYVRDLCEVIEGFVSMRLEGAGEGRREIKVRMRESDDGKSARPPEYLLTELSEGQRVLIGLYAVLHFALKPGTTLCFDEPDNFIALREVQPWLVKVLDRTEDDESVAQVLIASHHPEFLNRMAFKEGLMLDRPGGRHTRARRFDDPSQTGLTAAELVARGWERE
ncbi:MAG: ATP-binding protein [Phycisphaerales bacterium]|nr:ATP-binding protein [Phycisphaerales bacterium]